MSALLELEGLDAWYGGTQVLRSVSLRVEDAEVTTLLGSNGAGKTTLLRAVSNIMVRTSGKVRLAGTEIQGRAPDRIARLGIAHVPDGRGTLANLTVRENLMVGAVSRRDGGVIGDLERFFGYFPRLKERLKQPAGSLSGGEQQMLAISRALMMRPRLLLLDEPSFGLAPLVVKEIFAILERISAETKMAMLLVEQNAKLALGVAKSAFVIASGRIVLAGPADELARDDQVKSIYLGE